MFESFYNLLLPVLPDPENFIHRIINWPVIVQKLFDGAHCLLPESVIGGSAEYVLREVAEKCRIFVVQFLNRCFEVIGVDGKKILFETHGFEIDFNIGNIGAFFIFTGE